MNSRILIIGGYGNFGRFITTALAKEANLQLIVAGRHPEKGLQLAQSIHAVNIPESAFIDIDSDLAATFKKINPDIVIHTSGPFQSQTYKVAEACIVQGCHYIDLADAREFVNNIQQLDADAKVNKVLVLSGASSVPTLSCAIIDEYISDFGSLESVDYAITLGQLANPGLATTKAILSYVGKTFSTLRSGKMVNVYGWQGLRLRKFWHLNSRLISYCDIADLDLLAKRYPSLQTVRFRAGLGSKAQHMGLFVLSWLVRLKLIRSLRPAAPALLKMSTLLNFFGTSTSGFYMELTGKDKTGNSKTTLFEIAAHSGDGLTIPCIPSIIMANKLARGEIVKTGAQPCVGFISLDEYLQALRHLQIAWRVVER